MRKRVSNRYVYEVSKTDICCGKGKTLQSFKDSCDVNNIVSKYKQTGVLGSGGMPTRKPIFGDFSNVDYQTGMEMVTSARQEFDHLPAALRGRFDNNLQVMLDYMADPVNVDECVNLGLLPKVSNSVPNPDSNSVPETDVKPKPVGEV